MEDGDGDGGAGTNADAPDAPLRALPGRDSDPTLHSYPGIVATWGCPRQGLLCAASAGGGLHAWDPRRVTGAAFSGEKTPRCVRVVGARALGVGGGSGGGGGSAAGGSAGGSAPPLLRATFALPWGSACVFSDGSVTVVGEGGRCAAVCGALSLAAGGGEAGDCAAAEAAWGARALARHHAFAVHAAVPAGAQGAVLDYAAGVIAFPHVRTLQAVDVGGGGGGGAPRGFMGRTGGQAVGAHVPLDCAYTAVCVVDVWRGVRAVALGGEGVTCLAAGRGGGGGGGGGGAFAGVRGGAVGALGQREEGEW